MSYGFCADHTLRSWFNAVTAVRQAVGRLKYSGFSSTKGWNHSNWIVWHFKNTDRIRSRIKSNQVISGWQERNCPWYAAFSHFIIALHSIQASKISSWHMLLLMFYIDLSHVDVVHGPSRNQTDSGAQMPAVHHTLWWHEQKWYSVATSLSKPKTDPKTAPDLVFGQLNNFLGEQKPRHPTWRFLWGFPGWLHTMMDQLEQWWFPVSPTIMEVDNGCIWKVTTFGGTHFSLNHLW